MGTVSAEVALLLQRQANLSVDMAVFPRRLSNKMDEMAMNQSSSENVYQSIIP